MEAVTSYLFGASVTGTTWTTVMRVPAARMASGGRYLAIFATSSGLTDDGFAPTTGKFRFVLNGAVLPGSTANVNISGQSRDFSNFLVFDQSGTVYDLEVQLAADDADDIVHLYQPSLTLIRIDDLVEGTDYVYDEVDNESVPVDIPRSGAFSGSLLTAALTVPSTGVWLLLASSLTKNAATSNQLIPQNIYLDIDGTYRAIVNNTVTQTDQGVGSAMSFFVQSMSATQAVELSLHSPAWPSYSPAKHVFSKLFALKLDSFEHWRSDFGEPIAGQGVGLLDNPAESLALPGEQNYVALLGGFNTTFNTMNLRLWRRNAANTANERLHQNLNSVYSEYSSSSGMRAMTRCTAFRLATDREVFSDIGFISGWNAYDGRIGGYRSLFLKVDVLDPWSDSDLQPAHIAMAGAGDNVGAAFNGSGDLQPTPLTLAGTGAMLVEFESGGDLSPAHITLAGAGTFAPRTFTATPDLQPTAFALAGSGQFYIPERTSAAGLAATQTILSGAGTYTLPPCPAFTIADYGRVPISVNQGSENGSNYPLVDPSYDIERLLADFYLAYDEPADYDPEVSPFSPPFKIAWLFGFGCEAAEWPDFVTAEALHAADVVVHDADDRLVFDSTAGSHKSQPWSDRLAVHEWQTATAVCRLVVHTAWSPKDTPRNYDVHITPERGELDGRTIQKMPKRLRGIKVGEHTLRGEISLTNGFNTEVAYLGSLTDATPLGDVLPGVLSGAADGGPAGHRVELSAVPGSGEGRTPGCETVVTAIRQIAGVSPDKYGNFLLQGDQCYRFEQPAVRGEDPPALIPHSLTLHDDCRPCCTCEDFVQVKLGIDSVYDRWSGIAERLNSATSEYGSAVNRWNLQSACRESQNQQLSLTANCLGFIGIGYSFCSNSDECSGPLEIEIAINGVAQDGDRPVPAARGDTNPSPPTFTYSPNIVTNASYLLGLDDWTSRGAVTNAGKPRIGRKDWTGTNLLTNGNFASTLTNWTTAGYVVVSGDPKFARLGNPNGGIGRISQTVAVNSGQTYTVRLWVKSSSGTNRVVFSSGNGIVLQTTLVPADLANEYYEASVEATDSQLKVSVEAEVEAASYLELFEVRLAATSSELSQALTGLTPSGTYILKATLLKSVGAAEVQIGSHTFDFPADAPNFTVFTREFTMGASSASITFRSGFASGEYLGLQGVVLVRKIPDASGQVQVGGDGGGLSQSGESALNLAYVDKSANKNSVENPKLVPYALGGAMPVFTAEWEQLNPRAAAKLNMALFACNPVDGDSVTVTVSAKLAGVDVGEVSETIAIPSACLTKEDLCGAES